MSLRNNTNRIERIVNTSINDDTGEIGNNTNRIESDICYCFTVEA